MSCNVFVELRVSYCDQVLFLVCRVLTDCLQYQNNMGYNK